MHYFAIEYALKSQMEGCVEKWGAGDKNEARRVECHLSRDVGRDNRVSGVNRLRYLRGQSGLHGDRWRNVKVRHPARL